MATESFVIVCPNCAAEEAFESEKRPLIMMRCLNCKRQIILDHRRGVLYTVSSRFFKKVVEEFRTEHCGKIVAVRQTQPDVKGPIQKDKVESLKDLLSQDMDVNDFLDSIDDID